MLLPILNFQGQDDVCATVIEVQVLGPEFAKAVLVTWGEPGFCPPQCAGPLKVECTGLLKPGSACATGCSGFSSGSKRAASEGAKGSGGGTGNAVKQGTREQGTEGTSRGKD